MLSHYTGMNPGGTPGVLPPPYYWWEAGAMFNALIDYWYYTGDDRWNDMIMQAMIWQAGGDGTFMPPNQTHAEGNDDQAFWAFAAMSAAERNFPNPPEGQPGWLAMAQGVFNTQAPRWNTETCGGGLRWQIFSFNNGFHYKNTIANGCFFNLAARLARYTGNQTYADWAVRVWDWTESVGFITDDYLFLDGADELKNCTEFNYLQWTYNSGVYLFGAASMYNLTDGDPIWKERTQRILDATKVYFKNDVLYERACEPINTCGVDQRSFKGYLARWMAASAQVAPFILDQVMPKLRTSASAAARTCTGGSDHATCGMKWTSGQWDQSDDVGVQMSVLEVMQATLVGSVAPPVTEDNGGTSKGNPSAGTEATGPQPHSRRMSVVVNEGPNFEVKVEMVPVPEPGPDDILIRLNVTGICSSDLHMMQGDLGTPPMSTFGVRSPGHEGAGVVVKVGANVKNFKLGDRAGIKPLLDTCGACELCWGDKETYCRTAIHAGLMAPGTYQQYIVSPARYATPIPDGIPDEIAAPIMCSASTIYRSLTESGLKPGNWAVFPGGGGGVGIQGVQLAKAMGMRPVVVDAGESKRALALEMGAEVFIDFIETSDPAAAVIKATDGVGAHGVFVTAPAAYRTALSYVGNRIGAVVMCIGLGPTGAMTIGDDPNAFIFKNLTVKGTLVGSRQDTIAALDFARRGKLRQICEVYPIDRLPEAVEKLQKGQATGRMAVDFNK
ncbi:glycosyl hydrolase family 76-domain-containing protein [Aspergillus pseudocaelatus]|uniref:mannan endo-1,6-alpha-mannosidase n=1 Tax=Aspergillus pseudocaelatus TaxID=1825620 RepID=A0ABQ6WT75_9EURO|nr:glycosyl hydrolase family 76-domain-containing protein [Aspergillus pseudocaelatus]